MTMTMPTKTKNSLRCQTTRFGAIDVDEDLVITFPQGLIGFEACTRFVLIQHAEDSPFKWLQSLDEGSLAFPTIDPWQFKPDYAPKLCDADVVHLGLTESTPKLILTIVTIPHGNPHAITANLLGPLVINPATQQGKQAIAINEEYTTRHSIMEEMRSVSAVSRS